MNDARTDASTPASLSVDAYEEDWYRSLRALAERRRTELERFEDEDDVSEHAQERRPAATAAELTLEHDEPNGTQARGIPALADDPAGFWATSAPPSVAQPTEEPTATVAQPAEEPTATVAQPAEEPTATVAQPAEEPTRRDPAEEAPEAEPSGGRTAMPAFDKPSIAPEAVAATPAESPPAEEAARPDAAQLELAGETPAPDTAPSEGSNEPGGTWARILRPLRRLDPSPLPQPTDPTGGRAVETDAEAEAAASTQAAEPTPPEAERRPDTDVQESTRETGAPPAMPPEPAVDVTPLDSIGKSAASVPESAEASSIAKADLQPPLEPPQPVRASLSSRDASERRSALVAFEEHAPTAAELEIVAALVLDPDAEIRRLAVVTLTRSRARLDDAVVRQALQDPADPVRAAAVRAAATRGIRDLATLAPLVDARHSPQTHRTVLELLPKMLGEATLTAEDIDPLLLAVAQMQPPPGDDERAAFSDIAAAIGTTLLIEGLTLPDVRRLGAVRLLAGDRSHALLRALADRAGDPLEEVRQAGLAAADEIARIEADAASGSGPPDIGALADELRSSEPEDVDTARTALVDVPRPDVVAWCRERLTHADAESVATAAAVAAVLDLHEVGVELLTRAAALPSERRRPIVEALAAFPHPSELARLVSAVPSDTRPDAVRLLWEAAGQQVLPELRGLLADPAVEVRVALVDIVREAEDSAAIDAVADLLARETSPEVRAAAVRTIATSEGALASVIRALDDPDPQVRAAAVESIPASAPAEVGPALAQALTDIEERVRLAAIDRLAGVSRGDPALAWFALQRCRVEERDELLGALQRKNPEQVLEIALEHLSSPDHEERALAIEMIGWGASQAAVEAAIRALSDPLPQIRRGAVDALGRLRDRSAVAALGNRLGDPDPGVRVAAVRALGVIDDEGVLAYLVAALKDPDHAVRETTSHVLTEWSSPAVAKRLAGVLAVPSLRDSATDLLRRIGPTSVELLIDVLLQGGAELRSTVGPLLDQIIGVDEFLHRMDSLEPERRLRAIEALGAIAGPPAIESLTRALSDPDERIRLRSTQLLGELGDPMATDAVSRLVDDPVPEVAAAARHALEADVAGRGTPPPADGRLTERS